MAIGIKRPIKPARPVIDWGHPSTRGLVFDVPLFEKGGLVAHDIAGGLVGTIAGAPTWEQTPYGPGLNFSATGSVVYFNGATSEKFNNLQNLSYECLVNPTGSTLNYIYCKGITNHVMLIETTGTTLNIYFQYATSDGTWSCTIPINTYHHILITKNYAVPTAAPCCYVDGVKMALTVGDTASGALEADDNSFYLGNNLESAGTRTFQGDVVYIRAWNRIVTAQEAADLSANPWCIYRKNGLLAIDG